MDGRPTRVLCYSPYNRWALHGQWEMTILQGLKARGAEVSYVLCDGLYTDCDVHWAATDPRGANACSNCQARVAALVASMGMDYHWLGRYLDPAEAREARRWEQSLTRDELASATYGEWDVARWVEGSIHSHLRRSRLDVADPAVEKTYRSYLYSGLVACFALTRLLDETRPDVMLQFNGRQSSTRVALELARARGIRVICHERGWRKETLLLIENASCSSTQPGRRLWADWGDVPLTSDELAAIDEHLAEREHGRGLAFKAFTAAPQSPEVVRHTLGLREGAPTWVLFTSSDDEVVAEQDYRGGFASQMEWIERTVAYAAAHPEVDLVIRVHPNTGSRRSVGANAQQLSELRELGSRLPANVRLIDAEEELSSYTLMAEATVGLIYHSTVGLEVACKGKAVVAAAGSHVAGLPFVHTVTDAEGYEALLDELRALPVGAVDPEVRRGALRYAYGRFFRMSIPFPLVRMPNALDGQLAWSSLDEVQPGREAGLDRCVRVVVDGEAPVEPPTEAERAARDTSAEDAFLNAERRFTALAYADELIERPELLGAWASTFSGADPATLVIHTPAAATTALVALVEGAGLAEDGPDLLAVETTAGTTVDAVFSYRANDAGLPRFDDATVAELRARWID